MTTLSQILRPEDLQKVQAKFNFPIGEVPCEWGPTDGPYKRMASARADNRLLSSRGKIIFDPADWPKAGADLGDVMIRETLFHELFHLSQYRRGMLYRIKMWWWNKTLPYEKRPHEIEAHKMGHELAQNW